MGDVNCVAGGEVSGGREYWTPNMQVFKDCLTTNGLGPVRTVEKFFTWANCRLHNATFKRLDRMLAYHSWFSTRT